MATTVQTRVLAVRDIRLRRESGRVILFGCDAPIGAFCVWHPGVVVDHTCPVMRAQDLGLVAGSPVTSSWCLSSLHDVIAALEPDAVTDPRLLLWEDGALSVYYAPWDWVNTTAKVMLAGMTPGAYQAGEALREAQACLRAGYSSEETLRRAAAAGSFSGPMRASASLQAAGTRPARAGLHSACP